MCSFSGVVWVRLICLVRPKEAQKNTEERKHIKNFIQHVYTRSCDSKLQSGGAIWNGGEIKFLKRSKVLFESNEAGYDDETGSGGVGGHVANYGALVFRNEAIFDSGRSGSSGGAIYFRPNSNVFEPTRGVGLT